MRVVGACLVFFIFAAAAVWTAVWVNRRLKIPQLVPGRSGRVTSVAIRIMVSAVAINVVWAPMLLAGYVISALVP
jgi:hypothetical protein